MSRVLIKSKYHAEFKRYSIRDDYGFKKFEEIVKEHHSLDEIPFLIFYTDPLHGDLLPINNDENFAKAKSVNRSLLKIVLQAKGESYSGLNDFNKKRNFFDNLNNLLTHSNTKTPKLEINLMEDFHQVSSIIDADVLPKTCRRVKITKHGSDKPLGFYIRDGFSVRLTPKGLQKVPSIFISRVLPGGLAESTGLLAVNDEVLEVNGIDLLGKSIEQVTDMMVANASNLILTIKPVSQTHLNDSFMSTRSNTNSLQRNVQRNGQLQTQQQYRNSLNQYDKKTDHQKPNNLRQTSNLQQNNVQNNNGSFHNYVLQNNNSQTKNILQTNVQQQNSLQSYQYSSLRNNNNQLDDQKNLIQFQQNNSFNYHQPKNTNQQFKFNYLNQPQQISNQLFNTSGQNIDQYNSYLKMQQNLQNSSVSTFHPQQKVINHHKNDEENEAVANDHTYENSGTSNQNLIECLRRNYFGVEEQTFDEEEEDDDEDDEIMDYVNLNKMVNDKLKLRNVYQNTSNNQGLNVN